MEKEIEALEYSLKLYKMVESAGNGNNFNLNEAWEYHKNIKQALTTKSKKEQAFDIIKKYAVNDGWSNGWVVKFWDMNEEELELINEVLK